MKLKEKVDQNVTSNKLAKLYEQMIHHGDEPSAQKILDLYEKQAENEFVISFAGHFSAGKSSLLNYILGKEVLPKSPIPTSANIVKITSGEGVARIYFHNETTVQYDEPYDIDMIKDYCMDRDTIKQIEINTSEQILPQHTYLVDTPGIDAADDADRLMTESSLHIIDRLFYVMDYNHVQSEVNLYFLQEIQRQNIPFFIIINQIDKHNEEEIPFSQFIASVKQTFDQWNIKPEIIFYSSVMDKSVKHNEIDTIKSFIFELLNKKEQTDKQIRYATNAVIEQHKHFLREQYEAELIDTTSDVELDGESLQSLTTKLESLQSFSDDLQEKFAEEVNLTLNNAYLMPAVLRDLAHQFLESQQKDFKVGGFFRVKKRTEDEKSIRMETFLTELQKTIESTIQWRLRDKLSELLREKDIHEEHLFEFIQNIVITYTNEDILRLVNPGATVNGNYILNYTNEISADIKNKFRSETNNLWEKVAHTINEQNEQKINDLNVKMAELKDSLAVQEKNDELKNKLMMMKLQIDNIVKTDEYDEKSLTLTTDALQKRQMVVIEDVPVLAKKEEAVKQHAAEVIKETTPEQPPLDNVLQAIDRVVNSISDLHGFQSIVADLDEKKNRLNNRQLTIALFGAFSAGKSSFSNALFGEKILPVSPNPTTAVINRISPVTEEHKHGTVIITLKDSTMLANDINGMLKGLSIQDDDFHQLISKIKNDHLHEHDSLNKMYQAYLHALIDGYELQKDVIGTKVTISLDEFAAYVTDESKACYVEAVDLYYDCDVTRKGITIVDTPGADSINARHTNVAFDYIKYADAILYVTYYNHAITRADRDFLMQLGRVKESFELDKMFFIVNAADLAADEGELNLVLDYVKEQLLQFGIRFPNVFPVSSKQSIIEKLNSDPLNEKMAQFEEQFYSFIEEDLAKLTIQSAVWDMNRAHKMVLNYLKTANLDKQQQEKLVNDLHDKQQQIKHVINEVNTDRLKEQLQERIKRQLHYVSERLYIRFHDMFAEHYNPTTVTESGQRGMEQIRSNRTALIDYVGYELLQEVRAVSLRIEAFINTLLNQFHEQIEDDVVKIDESFILANYTPHELETPDYMQAFLHLDQDVFTPALRLFRGTKAFFEQNEREEMREAFYDILKPIAQSYIDDSAQVMISRYDEQISELTIETTNKILTDIESIIDNQLTLLTDGFEIDGLQQKETEINNVIKTLSL